MLTTYVTQQAGLWQSIVNNLLNQYSGDKLVLHSGQTGCCGLQMRGVHITLRMRLFCEVYRDGKPMKGQQYEVLNEVVVDRGANPYLTKIECYEQGRLITKVSLPRQKTKSDALHQIYFVCPDKVSDRCCVLNEAVLHPFIQAGPSTLLASGTGPVR